MPSHTESRLKSPPAEILIPEILDGGGVEARPLLIGTASAVDLLARQLRMIPGVPPPLGVVTAEDPSGLVGCGLEWAEFVEPLEALESVCARTGASLALTTFPAANREALATARAVLGRLGVVERHVPPLTELLSHAPRGEAAAGPFVAGAAGPVGLDLSSLIGRESSGLDESMVGPMIRGRCVLITGAGGSIGSELAQTVARFEPSRLVLVERGENALFTIDRAIASRFPGLERRAVLHDVTEADRTRAIVGEHSPAIVFHAAAHKHVPLMEDHPAHAVINNVVGTRAVAEASVACGAERFVLISTDKAVRPSSVMGATKRLAERLVASMSGGATRFASVRFGNVLGSAGSVLAVWSAQMAEGGPLTVTDERMTRYFMTIPEAAGLVVQAAGFARSDASEVFVLDMGEPVRIVDLAARFASAHGLAPRLCRGVAGPPSVGSLDIVLTGVRPGEKLHEELVYDAESLAPTPHGAIRRLMDAHAVGERDRDAVRAAAERCEAAARRGESTAVLAALSAAVPEYAPPGVLAPAA